MISQYFIWAIAIFTDAARRAACTSCAACSRMIACFCSCSAAKTRNVLSRKPTVFDYECIASETFHSPDHANWISRLVLL